MPEPYTDVTVLNAIKMNERLPHSISYLSINLTVLWRAWAQYSPYAPDSTVSPGTNNGGQRNDECTGWQFYHW